MKSDCGTITIIIFKEEIFIGLLLLLISVYTGLVLTQPYVPTGQLKHIDCW